MKSGVGSTENAIFFISLSYAAFQCGSDGAKKINFWRLNLPLEFFKIFFYLFEPHFWWKKKCSDFNSEHGNRSEDYVSGRLVYSDRFFDFSKNWVPGFGCFQRHFSSQNLDIYCLPVFLSSCRLRLHSICLTWRVICQPEMTPVKYASKISQ